jgi:hypothetical protein
MSCLPQPAPEDPLPLARQWLTEAEARISKNPWAMALATVARDGRISVRYVLLKELAESEGYIVFYTNYASRKASELESAGRAAGALRASRAARLMHRTRSWIAWRRGRQSSQSMPTYRVLQPGAVIGCSWTRSNSGSRAWIDFTSGSAIDAAQAATGRAAGCNPRRR